MPILTKQIVTLVAGIAVMIGSLIPFSSPLNDVLFVGGSGTAALGSGLIFLSWIECRSAEKRKAPQDDSGPKTPTSPAPVTAEHPSSTPEAIRASDTAPSLHPHQIPPTPTPAIEPPSKPASPPTSVNPSATTPNIGTNIPTERKTLPKIPKVPIPEPIIEHKVPIAFVAVGTALIIAALATISPQAGLFAGLFIPGLLILGMGSVILFLQLYRRPVGLRRFCMNCGFQMLTTDFACARCHKQPPSGVDTKVCPNCSSTVPALAKFCKDCGAGQPPIV